MMPRFRYGRISLGCRKIKSVKGPGFIHRCDSGATSKCTRILRVLVLNQRTGTGDWLHIANTHRLRVHAGRESVCRDRFREPSFVDNGSARRRRDRRQSVSLAPRPPVHEDGAHDRGTPLAFTNGVTETSVGHGPTGADEAYLPVRANATRGPADSCATHQQKSLSTRPRRWLSPGNRRGPWQSRLGCHWGCLAQWCPVPPLVVSFPSGVECRTVTNNCAPQAMVPNVASCRIVITFLVAE